MPGPSFGPTERKPRDTFWLTLGLCVLLPASGLALRYYGHLMFEPDQPAPLIEVSSRSAAPDRPSGLALLKPELAPQTPPEAAGAARSSLDLIAREPLGDAPPRPAAAALPAAPQAPPQEHRPYPKLKGGRGWRSWFQPPGDGMQISFRPAANAPELESATASKLEARAPTTLPQATPVAPAYAHGEPERRTGYRPPPVVYSANPSRTSVGPGGPTSEARTTAGPRGSESAGAAGRPDYTAFLGDPDTRPLANPEGPKEDGSCPRRGWWKCAYDGRCYETRPSCLAADYTHQGCSQPNP